MGVRTRIERILKYNERISTTEESRTVLDDWQLELERNLFKVDGHIIKSEILNFGNGRKHELVSF